jgi:hypothetical protein
MSTAAPVTVVRLGPGDAAVVHSGADLFDAPPTAEWTARFLKRDGHHVEALRALARLRGCYGMWVTTDAGNEARLRPTGPPAPSRPSPA